MELAGAVILDNNKKILLIHRNTKNLKQWELPGGKLEKDEVPEECAKRELKEELDVNINIIKYIGVGKFEENTCILRYHWYLSEIKEGIPKILEENFDGMKYFSKKELLKMKDLSENMKILTKIIDIEKL